MNVNHIMDTTGCEVFCFPSMNPEDSVQKERTYTIEVSLEVLKILVGYRDHYRFYQNKPELSLSDAIKLWHDDTVKDAEHARDENLRKYYGR